MAGGGNPNHAPAGAPGGTGGQFVSGPEAGGAPAKKATGKKFAKKPKKVTPTIKVEGGLEALLAQLQDLNQGISVGPLTTVEEIDQNIEKFWSKKVIEHVDRLFGNATGYCGDGQFHPKSNPNVNLNLFTCVFGKYRYPDNHAHLVTKEEYDRLSQDTSRWEKVYRGFTSIGPKRKNIMKGYLTADINNIDIYGNGVFGTNVYTSTDYGYSYRDYASRDDKRVLYCLVDKQARIIDAHTLSSLMRNKLSKDYNYVTQKYEEKPLAKSIRNKVYQHLMNNGMEDNRADDIANAFVAQLGSDMSLLASR